MGVASAHEVQALKEKVAELEHRLQALEDLLEHAQSTGALLPPEQPQKRSILKLKTDVGS
jgi:hypothetical protein